MRTTTFLLCILGLFHLLPAADQKADTTPITALGFPPSSQTTDIPKPDNYAAAAIEAVKNQRPDPALQFEVIGKPALKPEGLNLPMITPNAMVLVNLYQGTTVREQALVVFAEGRPPAAAFFPGKPVFSEVALDRNEFRQVMNELERFYRDAADVSRGSDRFYPYLPDDIRSLLKHRDRKLRMYMPPGAVDPAWREKLAREKVSAHALDGIAGWQERLSDEELRRFVAVQLDAVVQKTFLAIGGHEKEATALANFQRPQATVSNPREFTKLLEESVAQNRSLLQKSAFPSPDRFKAASDYMRHLIGYGFVAKEVSKPDPCPCFEPFSADAAFYVTSFGLPSGGIALHFSRMDGQIRIVCAALP